MTLRLALGACALLAGCRLEAPAPEPPPAVPGEATVDKRPAVVPDSVAGLSVTIGGETLRLDAQAVQAVARDGDPYTNQPTVALTLRPEAAERFAAMTSANVGKQAVVTLDGGVLVALSIMERIAGGRLVIHVGADEADAVEDRIRAATGTRPTV